MARKSTDIEVEERVLFILSCRSKGMKGSTDLLSAYTEQYPDFTSRQFYYDLEKAKKRISEYFSAETDLLVSELNKHYWELYNKALKIQDYRECRQLLNDIAKLANLYTSKHEVTGKDGERLLGNVVVLPDNGRFNEE